MAKRIKSNIKTEKKGLFVKMKELFSKKQPTEKDFNNGFTRGYNAAKNSNTNLLWGRFASNQDADIYHDQEVLRDRSRSLANNSPIFQHYLMMLDNNVVGKDGFKLKLTNKDLNSENMEKIIAIQEAWKDWSVAKNCDITERLNLTRIFQIAIQTCARDGEAIIRMIRSKSNKNNKYGFKLQMLDPARLDIKLNQELTDGRYIRMGIEFSKYGAPIAYHLKKSSSQKSYIQEGSTYNGNEHERIVKDDLLHMFIANHPEQTRGVPWGHAVMIYLEDLDDFNQACLLAAKVGASSSIYLEQDEPVKASDIADAHVDGVGYVMDIGVGAVTKLPRGAKFKSFDAKYPADAFDKYTKRILQQVAGGLGLSQVFLGNDTEDLNYSTARTVILEERNLYKKYQNFLIDFLLIIFNEWLLQSVLNSKIEYKKTKITKDFIRVNDIDEFSVAFIGRNFEAIDPLKEALANEKRYKNMTKPLSTLLAEEGLDLVETLDQYKQDDEIIKKILNEDFKLFVSVLNEEVAYEENENENKKGSN